MIRKASYPITFALGVMLMLLLPAITGAQQTEPTQPAEQSSWGKAGQEVGEAARAVGEASGETVQKVKNKSAEIWEKAKEKGAEIKEKTVETTTEVVDQTAETGKEAWEKAKTTSTEMVDQARAKVHELTAPKPPVEEGTAAEEAGPSGANNQ